MTNDELKRALYVDTVYGNGNYSPRGTAFSEMAWQEGKSPFEAVRTIMATISVLGGDASRHEVKVSLSEELVDAAVEHLLSYGVVKPYEREAGEKRFYLASPAQLAEIQYLKM